MHKFCEALKDYELYQHHSKKNLIFHWVSMEIKDLVTFLRKTLRNKCVGDPLLDPKNSSKKWVCFACE